MENLRRGGGHAHLHVVLGAQLQEAFQPGGGVLRALTFVAVRQQQGEAAQTPPLGFAGGHELVDHHLGAVGEVTELRFPDDQCFRGGGGVAVLEAQHRLLGEQRIVDIKARLTFLKVGQRHIVLAVLLVVQHRMAVREGTAPGILAGEPHHHALVQQAGVGEGLAVTPVDRHGAGGHFAAVLENLLHLPLQHHALGHGFQTVGQILEFLERVTGVPVVLDLMADVGAPVHEQGLVGLAHQ